MLVILFLSSATDVLLVVTGVIGAIATRDTWTHWYSLAIIAVTLPSSWLGARIFQSRQSHI